MSKFATILYSNLPIVRTLSCLSSPDSAPKGRKETDFKRIQKTGSDLTLTFSFYKPEH